MIEKFWGDLFCLEGIATYGVKNELVDGGMKVVLMIEVVKLRKVCLLWIL